MMKVVTDKKYKLQIELKLWSDQYHAAINCFGLLLEHFKESLWINLGSQILIDLWWNSCQTVKTPLNIQNLPNSKKTIMHQTTKNDIIYYGNIQANLWETLSEDYPDRLWRAGQISNMILTVPYALSMITSGYFLPSESCFWSYLITCYDRIPSVHLKSVLEDEDQSCRCSDYLIRWWRYYRS